MHLNRTSFMLWKDVQITGGFWKKRQETNERVTLPAEYEQCVKTGRIESVKCLYHPEEDRHPRKGVFTIDGVLAENLADEKENGEKAVPRPHHYWDSDLAKWIEAASYSLAAHPDQGLEKQIDEIVDDFEKLQMEDGYLNTYYTVVEPGQRWTNVYTMHELYCAGHLMEAACAYYQATGKKKFLEIICRYADCIDRTFGIEDGKIHGYPGHQEIELALVKLYRVTGEKRYLNLARYFIDERGKQPSFFEEEALAHGRDPEEEGPKGILGKSFLPAGPYALFQAHLPVREQKTAEGHAVRVAYMGCAMADLAAETGDESLWNACVVLWKNVTQKRMYLTGGIGAKDGSERFSFDYHLPNESAYQETCASVGMTMWAARMLQIKPDSVYADIMERALYNSVISGVSLAGDTFFYANHLAAKPEMFSDAIITNPRMFPRRQKWFAVSCCPMNLARLLESVGGYIYSESETEFFVHLFIDSVTETVKENTRIQICQETQYPWDNKTRLIVTAQKPVYTSIAVRDPAFSRNTKVLVDGKEAEASLENGYLYLRRMWEGRTGIIVEFEMEPMYVEAHPCVRMDAGKTAIQYGPLIYCLEEADNGPNLSTVFADTAQKLTVKYEPDLLGGVCVVEGKALRACTEDWEGMLYRPIGSRFEEMTFRAVPYYAWSNREPGEMTVWINRVHTRTEE